MALAAQPVLQQPPLSTGADAFISHASEDKDAIARPLAEELERRGFTVWYDEYTLRLGDSLQRTIDRGLATSRFGVIVLSPSVFAKEWPQRELGGLAARETGEGRKVILPVWHNVDQEYIRRYSPPLADKLGVSTSRGLEAVVTQIAQVLREENRHSMTVGSEDYQYTAVASYQNSVSDSMLRPSPVLSAYLYDTDSLDWELIQGSGTRVNSNEVILINRGRTPARYVQLSIEFSDAFSHDFVKRSGGTRFQVTTPSGTDDTRWQLRYDREGRLLAIRFQARAEDLFFQDMPVGIGVIRIEIDDKQILQDEYEVRCAIAAENMAPTRLTGRWTVRDERKNE